MPHSERFQRASKQHAQQDRHRERPRLLSCRTQQSRAAAQNWEQRFTPRAIENHHGQVGKLYAGVLRADAQSLDQAKHQRQTPVTKHFYAASAEELKITLAAVYKPVLRRLKGRTKDQIERFSIAHLLASLPCEEVNYPLILIHRDRPDFFLKMAHREIGIEHMEAVPENHVRESIYRQQGIGPTVHMLKKHQPGEVSRSNDSILTDIVQDKAGAPWVGNEVEIEWAKVMLHCIDVKNAALNKSGFTRACY